MRRIFPYSVLSVSLLSPWGCGGGGGMNETDTESTSSMESAETPTSDTGSEATESGEGTDTEETGDTGTASDIDFVYVTASGAGRTLWAASLSGETQPFSATLQTAGSRCPVRWLDGGQLLALEHVDPAVPASVKAAVIYELDEPDFPRQEIANVLVSGGQVAADAAGQTLVQTEEGIIVFDLDAGSALGSGEAQSYESSVVAEDGSIVAFARSGNDDGRLYEIDAATGEGTSYAEGLEEPCSRWLDRRADGGIVAACVTHGGSSSIQDLYLWAQDGSSTLLSGADQGQGWSYRKPSWSPDGTRVVAARGGAGPDEVVVVDANPSETVKLADTASAQRSPTWIDNDTVLYVVDAANGAEVYSHSLASGSSELVLSTSEAIDFIAARGARFDTAACL